MYKNLKKGQALPCERTVSYLTSQHNQAKISFMLRQGNSDKASECLSLGKYECINIPPAPAGGVKI